jgi:outer membrane receptor protein involved in Fe transport
MRISESGVAQVVALAIVLANCTAATAAGTLDQNSATAAVTSRVENKNHKSPTVRDRKLEAASSTGIHLAQAGPPAPGATAAGGSNDEGAQALKEVVVTGTRIQRANLSLATPITQVGSDFIKSQAPANIADTLNTLPQMSIGLTPGYQTFGTSGAVNGINALNLLNLGDERTLVLEDGRRLTGFNSTGVVDINNIPQQLIERVDVVTGGGSADYGSDAVAGVVNFILNTDFTGFKYEAQWGESIYSDDKNGKLEATYGTPLFGGRGHFIISGQYSNQGEVGNSDTRPWFNSTKTVGNPVAGASPAYILAPNVNEDLASPGGLIINSPVNGALAGTQFGPGGAPQVFQFGPATGTGGLMFGGTKNDLAGLFPIQSSVDTRNVFSRLSYDLTENTTLYTELSFAESHDVDPAVYQFELGSVSIASGNPFLPSSVQSQMTTLGLSHLLIGTWNQDIGPLTPVDDYKDYHAVLGLDSKLSGSWSLKAYYQYGRSNGTTKLEKDIIKANYTQAVNAVRDPATGAIVCANPANGCVPLDVLGTGVATQEAINWATGTAWRTTDEEENDAAITLQGNPVSTWAGPVSLALGPEWRREEATGDVDPLSLTSAWFAGNFHPIVGAYDVKEFFAETYIPLARKVPFAQSLDIDAAARATDYSTSGYVTTWKVGATWAPVHDLMFRASTSRDIRAPNISDLDGVLQATQTVTDPAHGNASDTIAFISGGNSALRPEIARNYSYGVVYSPAAVPGLRASFDYYKVNVSGYVTAPFNAQQAVTLCYQGDMALCPFVTRNASGAVTQVELLNVNSGSLQTEGFNISTSYAMDLSRLYAPLGILSAQIEGTRLEKYFLNNGFTAYEYAGSAGFYPKWKLEMPLQYNQGPVTVGFTGRYVGPGIMSTVPPILPNHVPGTFYLDGSLAYKTPLGLELFASAHNIFNKYPPAVGAVGALTFLSNGTAQGPYDLTGTTFEVGVRGQF